jgi:hypothetical protein
VRPGPLDARILERCSDPVMADLGIEVRDVGRDDVGGLRRFEAFGRQLGEGVPSLSRLEEAAGGRELYAVGAGGRLGDPPFLYRLRTFVDGGRVQNRIQGVQARDDAERALRLGDEEAHVATGQRLREVAFGEMLADSRPVAADRVVLEGDRQQVRIAEAL